MSWAKTNYRLKMYLQECSGFWFYFVFDQVALLLLHTNELLETLCYPFLVCLCSPAWWKCWVYTELFWYSTNLGGSSPPCSVWINESALRLCTFGEQNIRYCWNVVGCRLFTLPPLSSHPHILAWCTLRIIPWTHPGFIFKAPSSSLLPRIANLLSEAMLKENGKCELSSESLISVFQSEWSHMKE